MAAGCCAAGAVTLGLGGADGDFLSQAVKAMRASAKLMKVSCVFMAIPNIECIKFDPVWVGSNQYNSQNLPIQRQSAFSQYAIYIHIFLQP